MQSREIIPEQMEWQAKQPSKWLPSWRIKSAEQLETLPLGTEPWPSHHQLPARGQSVHSAIFFKTNERLKKTQEQLLVRWALGWKCIYIIWTPQSAYIYIYHIELKWTDKRPPLSSIRFLSCFQISKHLTKSTPLPSLILVLRQLLLAFPGRSYNNIMRTSTIFVFLSRVLHSMVWQFAAAVLHNIQNSEPYTRLQPVITIEQPVS